MITWRQRPHGPTGLVPGRLAGRVHHAPPITPIATTSRSRPWALVVRQGDGLGAERQAVAGILEIRAGHHAAIGQQHGCADAEAGIRRMGVQRRRARGGDQPVADVDFGGHGATTFQRTGPSIPSIRRISFACHIRHGLAV